MFRLNKLTILNLKWILISGLFISINSCQYDPSDINISFNECEYMLLDTNVVIVDVRTQSEIKEGFIYGARFMNFYDNDFKDQISTLDKQKPTIVYCQKGGRSLKTCKMMQEMGFERVYNLEGGSYGWFMHGKKMTISEK